VRYAVGVPNVASFADPRFLVDLASGAEGAGWDGFFVWDHLTYRDPDRRAVDAWSVIAAVAAVTSHLRLGVLVTALPRRHPAAFAQQAATVDLLSSGRLVVGAGLGSLPTEYSAFGDDPDLWTRGRKLDEALDVVIALWRGEPVRHRGEFFSVDTSGLSPTPVQRPRPPVWIAGRWPNRTPMRRAARYDGLMPTHADHGLDTFMSPDELAEIVRYVGGLRPDRAGFDVVMEGQSDDGDHLSALSVAYEAVGLTWWVEKVGWWRGDRADARRRVEAGPPGR